MKTVAEQRCNRCGHKVYESQTAGYTYQCIMCDEDLYTFETHEYHLFDKTTYIVDLPKDVQQGIHRAVYNSLLDQEHVTSVNISAEYERAMSSRLCDLEDLIDIKPFIGGDE